MAAKKKKRRERAPKLRLPWKPILAVAVVTAVAAFLYWFLVVHHTVKNVRVDGNTRYTNEEVSAMVVNSFLTRNTLYLGRKYKKGITDLPFIEKVDVRVTAPDSVWLIVYEKSTAGYIEYLGQYMYFDREGIVVEAAKERSNDVPQVLGLDFEYVVMNEPLPVENDTVFQLILNITQLLEKYGLKADRIFFDASYRVYLYFGGVEAELGDSSYIDEKLEQLVHILPSLEGKRGILRMKDYTPVTKNITFEER